MPISFVYYANPEALSGLVDNYAVRLYFEESARDLREPQRQGQLENLKIGG